MTKRLLILLMSAGMVLHAVAQAPSTTPGAAAGAPAAESKPTAPASSLEKDSKKALGTITSSVASAWQRMTRAVDSFLKAPPATPAPVVQPLPPMPVQAAQPAKVAVVTPPASPQPAPAPAQPQPAPPAQPPPAKPATAAAVQPPAQTPPAAAPAKPAKVAALASTSPQPVQPAGTALAKPVATATARSSATQLLVHPINVTTGAQKYAYSRSVWPEATMQNAPISLDVNRIVRKKYDTDVTPVQGTYGRSHYRESASLCITVQNLSPQLLTNVVIRWAIVKKPVGHTPSSRSVPYGAQELVVLKPVEEKIIETASIEVEGMTSQTVGRSSGEMIRGHAVQVLIGTNVVAEELFPTTLKVSFKKLQPVPKPPPKE